MSFVMTCQKYYNNKYIICGMVFVLMVQICSCNRNTNERIVNEVKEMTGRTIVFPDTYKTISCDKTVNINSLLRKKIKIVSYIDYLSCTQCEITMMAKWTEAIKEIDSEIAYIIVVQTELKKELEELIYQNLFCELVMCYSTDTFMTANNLDILARNKTFLLNKENKIVLVGEPFDNEKLTQLYKKTIESLKEEYVHE